MTGTSVTGVVVRSADRSAWRDRGRGRAWLAPEPCADRTAHLDIDPADVKDIFERSFLRGVASELADDLVELSGDVQPDVLARESIEFVGSAAAEPR
jgi:hypothetical protein